MSNIPPTYNDEVDLISLIQTVWDGKWKIVSIVAVSLLSVLGFNIVKPNTTFIASIDIKPITSFKFEEYSLFNSSLKIIEKKNKISNIFEISQKSLLNLYIERIEEGSLLETAVDKFNLINKDNFLSESDYKGAVEKFASEIEVVKPIKEKHSHHVLKVKYNDEEKWKDLLVYVNEKANKTVKASIINRFKTMVSVQDQKKDFAIEDLEIKIDNVKKDYDRYTKDRLAFLAEQAAIARKLDIKSNTITSLRFDAQNTFVTNVNTDTPFYLRGYVAIEEEIKQITTRKDKNAFIKDLYKLEQQKRDLEQDETIQRAVDLFNRSPLNKNDFQATIVKVATTDFQTYDRKNLYYGLTIILSSVIGVFYILIVNALRNRKINSISS